MGHPIRSNVFRDGTWEQEQFSRYYYQVAFLFSPSDRAFKEAVSEAFVRMDRDTGKHVAFFAVLDPPDDWLQLARHRLWWHRYQMGFGELGFSVDDGVLVNEIARLFGVEWDEFPVLVIASDLSRGPRLALSTSIDEFEHQLALLTALAETKGRVQVEMVADYLSQKAGQEVVLLQPPRQSREQFALMYETLERGQQLFGENEQMRAYFANIERQIRAFGLAAKPTPRSQYQWNDPPSLSSNRDLSVSEMERPSQDPALSDLAGRLTAPATVAMHLETRLADLKTRTHDGGGWDDYSWNNLQTSIRVGRLLEYEHWPQRHSDPLSQQGYQSAAQGVWLAFERELNVSIIQAARASRSVPMPHFFQAFYPSLPEARAEVTVPVHGGGHYTVSLNLKGRKHPGGHRHRFLTLGQGSQAVQALLRSSGEFLNEILRRVLGEPFPADTLNKVSTIVQIRNIGSHPDRDINRSEYRILIDAVTSNELILPFFRIKQAVKSGIPDISDLVRSC